MRWKINGVEVAKDTQSGGLKVLDMDRSMLIVKVIGETEGMLVSAIIECPGEEPQSPEFVLAAALPDLLDEVALPSGLPPDGGFDLDAVTFDASPWPLWRRPLGFVRMPTDVRAVSC